MTFQESETVEPKEIVFEAMRSLKQELTFEAAKKEF